MEKNFKRTLVTTALPYANGPVHIGHLAGVYVPADIYTRYLLLPSDLWRLCLVPVVYVVLYLGGAYMLKLEMLQEMLSMLKSRVKRGGEA